jgi:hypothetical protein
LRRDPEHCGGFLDAQAAEKAHLNHPRLAFVQARQAVESIVEGD